MADLARLEDAELIAQCLEQEAEAWEALVRRYQRLIASITFKYRLAPDEASDIFQSVCLTLFQQLPALRKHDKLSSWIITVAARECWKFRSRQAQTESLSDPQHEDLPELASPAHLLMDDSLLMLERQHLVRRAVELLPEQCRRLLEHLFYRDEATTYAEISRQMGMPVASIGPTRARCLEKLKGALKKSSFF